MQSTLPGKSKKSTTGRSEKWASAGLRLLSALAPGMAERLALELFLRPRTPRAGALPVVPGLPAHRFDLTVSGQRLAAWDWGEGPTVLLAHGWNGRAAQLSAFVEPLVRAGHYVVAFDQPAHGQSEGVRTNLVEMAAAVRAVGKRTGPLHAVIAHSMGGAAATLALARGLEAQRAVFIAPPADVRVFAAFMGRHLGLPEARVAGMLARLAEKVGPLEELQAEQLAPQMKAKLLVMHDPLDREVPFAHGKTIAEAWPGAVLEALSGLGHNRPLRDAGVVKKAVEFVSQDLRPLARSA